MAIYVGNNEVIQALKSGTQIKLLFEILRGVYRRPPARGLTSQQPAAAPASGGRRFLAVI